MSGFVGDLSPQQEGALRKLRRALRDVKEVADKDDHYFLRWLRARKFNVAQAEDMLRKHIDVRKKYSLDTILADYKPIEVLQRFYPGGHMGEDREGHPVWYENFNFDLKGLHYSVRLDDIIRLCLYRAELGAKLCAEASSQNGRHIETLTLVIDYEKMSIRRHYYWPGIQMAKKVLSLLEANYPEAMKHVFLLNTPSFFPWCYNMMKGLLDESTRSKIFFLRSDYKEVLQKYISPDQLPEAYGGTRCEPDPYCTKYINPGGDIPETYYLSNLMEISKEEMERVVVGRASSHLITHHVDTPGTILRWDFMSTDHDIGYGWYLKSRGGRGSVEVDVYIKDWEKMKLLKHTIRKHKKERFDPATIAGLVTMVGNNASGSVCLEVPVKRRKSHIIPESGVHTCECAGEYVLKFDNSYSWTRSKEVFYSVKMVPPESELAETTPTETYDSVEQSSVENGSVVVQ